MGEGPGQAPLGYRRDIDGLRAVAVLAVVAFHVGLPGAAGGFVGVDVFFAISGFLITGLLAREIERTGTVALSEFYARRVRRLLPALATVILATLVLGAFVLPPTGEQQALARSALATAAFVSNLHFWQAAGDYFADQTESMPLLHTWSLAVEEQFYVVWPALLLLLAWLARRSRRPFAPLAVLGLTLVSLASFAAGVWATTTWPLAAFYLTPFRAWEFAAGGLLALRPWAPRSRVGASGLASAGLLAIVAASLAFGPETAFPGVAALLPVAGTLWVIAAGTGGPANPVSSLLATAPLVRIGQLSYSWYLWHWPLLVIVRAAARGERALGRDTAVALGALLLAELTYRLIENPIHRRRPAPFHTTRAALASGLALSVALAAGASWAEHRARALDFRVEDAGPMNPGCNGFVAREICTNGPWGRSPGLLLWGDSHAARLSSLAVAFGAETGTPLLQRTSIGCPPLLRVVPTRNDGRPNLVCGSFNNEVQAEIGSLAAAGQLRGVVLAARWPNYLAGPREGGGVPRRLAVGGQVLDHAESVEALHSGLAARLDALQAAGLRVVVVATWPEFPWPVASCLRRGEASCSLPRPEVESERDEAMSVLRRVIAGRSGVRLVDPLEAFCSADACSPLRSGELVYADQNHLTFRAAASLLPRARADLRWLVGLPES
jgi:peptidoglycan/LPS O-acetylase OafA/YrhL